MGQELSSEAFEKMEPRTLDERSIEAVARLIQQGRAKNIVVMTGAGISTAAGIPDFRSPGTGLYANLKRLNLPYAEAVFSIDYFRQNPHPFYVLAKELYPGQYHPTVSHAFLALLARKGLLRMLFTQNIDCLERAAGIPPDRIIEAHGSFATQRCIDCGAVFPDEAMQEHVREARVPRCGSRSGGSVCGGLVKPDIVFFGESLPGRFHQTVQDLFPRDGTSTRNSTSASSHSSTAPDLVLILGTSLTVFPFAGLPGRAPFAVPRVLFNRERVGDLGSRPDDVVVLGRCDDGVRRLAAALGWADELEQCWRGLVGDAEAERQRSQGGLLTDAREEWSSSEEDEEEEKDKAGDKELDTSGAAIEKPATARSVAEEEVDEIAEKIEEVLRLGLDAAAAAAITTSTTPSSSTVLPKVEPATRPNVTETTAGALPYTDDKEPTIAASHTVLSPTTSKEGQSSPPKSEEKKPLSESPPLRTDKDKKPENFALL